MAKDKPNNTGSEENNREKRRTVELLHKMIDEVEDYAIILLDVDGIIRNWNKGAEKIKQYTEAEAIGMPFQRFYLPKDQASGLPETLLNQARKEGRAAHEGWRVRKDGSKFWGSIVITALHDNDGNIIGFFKITRDLTERKISEDKHRQVAEDLRKSEERYHKMIAEVEDYAIILLNDNGYIQNWNIGAERIKGYKTEEILGRNFRIFYRTQDQDSGLPEKLIQTARNEGKAVHEGWRVRKDGSEFWGSIVITALHDQQQNIIGFSKVTRDLTERKHSEDQLRAYLAELETRNRELEQFAYIASHDLQEPLRKIRTFTDVIQRNRLDEELVTRYFEKINASAQRMSELINAILNFSRMTDTEDEFVACDLNTILSEIKFDFELLMQEKNASLVVDRLPVIDAIPLQMNQLFANLVGNALKFSPKDPVIRVSAKQVDLADIPDAPAYLPDTIYTELSFSDNGIGFEPEYEKQVFSLFQRLHNRENYPGTGIGLALCKRIMDNHGGYIRAEGKKGIGATFYTYFPLTHSHNRQG